VGHRSLDAGGDNPRMLNRMAERLDRHRGWGVLALRLAVGIRLIEGTQDNVFSAERMEEFAKFLAAHGTPAPHFSAYLSAYAQFICGILFVLGLFTRPAGMVMTINFIAALLIAHRATPFLATWQAAMMLAAAIYFLLCGAGSISLDRLIRLEAPRSDRRG
jgi:putative oxidoreductase